MLLVFGLVRDYNFNQFWVNNFLVCLEQTTDVVLSQMKLVLAIYFNLKICYVVSGSFLDEMLFQNKN